MQKELRGSQIKDADFAIHVCHYPPGTPKWNKIEHLAVLPHHAELARPAATYRLAVVELIGATTTKTGLKVESALDTRSYKKGIKIVQSQD